MDTILFGRVPAENLIYSSDYFEHNGNSYYFSLTVAEDQVYLEDTCGRMVPLDLDVLKDAAMSFTMAAKIVESQDAAIAAYDEVINDYRNEIEQTVTDWNTIRA